MTTSTDVSKIERLHTVPGTRLSIVEPGTLQVTGEFDKRAATTAVKGILKADASKLAYSMQLGASLARSWNPEIDPAKATDAQKAEYAELKSRIQSVLAGQIKGENRPEKDQRRNIADRALAVALGYLVPDAKVEIAQGKKENGAVKSPARVALQSEAVKDKTVTNMGRDIRAQIGITKPTNNPTGTRQTTTAPDVAHKAGEPAKSRGGTSTPWKTQVDHLMAEIDALMTDPQRVVYLRTKVDKISARVQKAAKKANAKKADANAQKAKATPADKAKRDAQKDIARDPEFNAERAIEALEADLGHSSTSPQGH